MNFLRFFIFVVVSFVYLSCQNGGNVYLPFKGESESYSLSVEANPSQIYGAVTFTELEDRSALVNVLFDSLQSPAHSAYPVALFRGNLIDGGNVVAYLNPIEENKFSSKSVLSEVGIRGIDYMKLVDYNGHVNIFNSDTTKVLYRTDIGQNALLENKKRYIIESQNDFLFSGNAELTKRKNGDTQVLLRLSNVVFGQNYDVVLVGGSIEKSKKDTLASLGKIRGSNSNFYLINIPSEKDGMVLSYDKLLQIDAHLEFVLENNLVAAANIGTNSK